MADGQTEYFDNLKDKIIAQTRDEIPKRIDKLTALYEAKRTSEETTTPEALIDSVLPYIHEMRSYLSDVRMLTSHYLVKQMNQPNGEVVLAADKLEALSIYVEEVAEKCKEMEESWILEDTEPEGWTSLLDKLVLVTAEKTDDPDAKGKSFSTDNEEMGDEPQPSSSGQEDLVTAEKTADPKTSGKRISSDNEGMQDDPQPTSSGQEGLVTTKETDDTDGIELFYQSIADKITIQNTVDFVSYMVSAYIMLGHYVEDTFKIVDESVSHPLPMFLFGNGQQQSGNEEEGFDNNFDYFN